MDYFIKIFLNFLIIIPATIGLMRLHKIHNSYYVFIWLLCVGVLNECIGNFSAFYFRTTAINSNIYCLAEALLITYQFYKWDLFRRPVFFYTLMLLFPLIWITENLILGDLITFNSFFTVFYSLITVLESIIFINRLMVSEKESLLKNARFIICIAFIIFFTYNGFIEMWWKYGSGFSKTFNINLHNIFIAINLFINILFSYGILCMRQKPPSLIP